MFNKEPVKHMQQQDQLDEDFQIRNVRKLSDSYLLEVKTTYLDTVSRH